MYKQRADSFGAGTGWLVGWLVAAAMNSIVPERLRLRIMFHNFHRATITCGGGGGGEDGSGGY